MDVKLILQIAGVVLGLLYLYLEFKASLWLWVVGIIMPAVHAALYFRQGLYADFGMQGYYVAAGIWGFCTWIFTGKGKKNGGGRICPTPVRLWPLLTAVCAALNAGLYFFLRCCTDSTVPFWDGLTTALSIVAMWMLSRKYTEQWLVWMAVDAVTVGLYFYKGLELTACLYILYTCLAAAGYIKWKHLQSSDL